MAEERKKGERMGTEGSLQMPNVRVCVFGVRMLVALGGIPRVPGDFASPTTPAKGQ